VRISVAPPVEDKGLGALGEALGDDLGVEGVGEDLGPVLERPGSVGRGNDPQHRDDQAACVEPMAAIVAARLRARS